MSTSPEKDLHSVYIDGEMPETFISQYKKAVSENENSKAQLEKMQKLHELLQEDARAKTVDSVFAEQSFEKLQSRLSYSRTISVNKKSYVLPFVKYASSFAAAAAVFAVVFIPVHNKAVSEAKLREVAAIEITKEKEIKPISEKQVLIDGSLKSENLSQGIAVAPTKKSSDVNKALKASQEEPVLASLSIEESSSLPVVEQKTVRASTLASNRGRQRFNLPSVDPFRPDFSESPARLSVPKIGEMRNNFETHSQE